MARTPDQERALQLTNKLLEVAPRLARRSRGQQPKPVTSEPQLRITLAAGAADEAGAQQVLRLAKSAVLYADKVVVVSPLASMLLAIEHLSSFKTAEQLSLIEAVGPIIDKGFDQASLATYRSLLTKRNRSKDELLLVRRLKTYFDRFWPDLVGEIEGLIRTYHLEPLKLAAARGVLEFDPMEEDLKTTDELVDAFGMRLKQAVETGHSYPLLDDVAGGLVRAALAEGIWQTNPLSQARAKRAGLASGTVSALPAFPEAAIEDILDARSALESHLSRFRRAVNAASSKMRSEAVEEEFSGEVADIYLHEVEPAIQDIRDLLGQSRWQRLLKAATEAAPLPVIALAISSAGQVPDLLRIGLTAAGLVGSAAAKYTLDSARLGREAEQKDFFFLYGIQQQLERA